eukprot:Pgem_evm1s18912
MLRASKMTGTKLACSKERSFQKKIQFCSSILSHRLTHVHNLTPTMRSILS